MFGKRVELFQLFGFPVRIDASWLIIAVLITWSLAAGLFPGLYKDMSTSTYWLMGVVGALGLFASIVVHEFAHAMVARRFGMPMNGITLFIFGGVAEMRGLPPSAEAEFNVAIAGPIMTIAVGGLCGAAYGLGQWLGAPLAVNGVLGYLATINFVLVAFNIVPAFPLDGGRVLRSALWKWKNDVRWATRISSEIGSGFGAALIVLGVFAILVGDFVGGMWWVLIGLFLRTAAKMSYHQLVIRRSLEGEPVRRFMNREATTVPPDVDLQHVVDDYIYQHHHKMFPVVENGTLHGCITIGCIKDVSRDNWSDTSAKDVMEPCGADNTISPDEDALEALSRMHNSDTSRLMVVEDTRLVGIITLKDLLRFIATKVELEGDGDATPFTDAQLQRAGA